MGIEKNIIKIMAITLLPLFFGCNGCKTLCVSGNNQLKFNDGTINLYPNQDSIKIGDTVLISSIIPLKLQPTQNGQPFGDSVDFSDASNMITDINFNTIIKYDSLTDALDSFVISPIKGSIQTNPLIPHAGKTVQYIQQSNNYFFSFYLIAQKKGVYIFSIEDIFRAEKKCTNASIIITVNDSDPHLHYLHDIYYGGNPVDPVDQTHSYCFKVY